MTVADYPFIPLFTDAYLGDCAHLTDAQHGRYLRLLMLMWRTPGCRVPNDDTWLAIKLSRSVEAVQQEIRPIVEEFCQCTSHWITQKRLRREWLWCKNKSQTARQSAKARWDKEKHKSKRNTSAQRSHMPSQSEGNAPTEESKTLKGESETLFKQRGRSQPKAARAARWGNGLSVTAEWKEEGAAARARHGLPPVNIDLEADKFNSHWLSAPVRRTDWRATWRKWILSAEAPRNARNGPTPHEKFAAGALAAALEHTEPSPTEDHG